MFHDFIVNNAPYVIFSAIGACAPIVLKVIAAARRKTQSKTMANLYSIAESVIISAKPVVDRLKKKGVFDYGASVDLKNRVIKEIKEQLSANHVKLIRGIMSDTGATDKFLGHLVEFVLDNHKRNTLPTHYKGFSFNWKF